MWTTIGDFLAKEELAIQAQSQRPLREQAERATPGQDVIRRFSNKNLLKPVRGFIEIEEDQGKGRGFGPGAIGIGLHPVVQKLKGH